MPFLKVDKGLADEADGVQVMKPMPGLDDLLARAVDQGIFGTKMRSVVKVADATASTPSSTSSSRSARQIVADGLVPILEPEVDIHSPSRPRPRSCSRTGSLDAPRPARPRRAASCSSSRCPRRTASTPTLVEHPNVLRVVALSGGYSREEANARLARNPGVIASFSRALTEGLTAQQSDDEFDAALGRPSQHPRRLGGLNRPPAPGELGPGGTAPLG